MNETISNVIIAPMTTQSQKYPTRVPVYFMGKRGWVVLDQLRTVNKRRLVNKLGTIKKPEITEVKSVLKEMLVD